MTRYLLRDVRKNDTLNASREPGPVRSCHLCVTDWNRNPPPLATHTHTHTHNTCYHTLANTHSHTHTLQAPRQQVVVRGGVSCAWQKGWSSRDWHIEQICTVVFIYLFISHIKCLLFLFVCLTECDKLRKDGFRSSQYYSQGPTFSDKAKSTSSLQDDDDDDDEKKVPTHKATSGRHTKVPGSLDSLILWEDETVIVIHAWFA